MDDEDRGVTESTSSLFLHMKVDEKEPRSQNNNRFIKEKGKKAGVQSSSNAELDVTAPRSNKCCFPL